METSASIFAAPKKKGGSSVSRLVIRLGDNTYRKAFTLSYLPSVGDVRRVDMGDQRFISVVFVKHEGLDWQIQLEELSQSNYFEATAPNCGWTMDPSPKAK